MSVVFVRNFIMNMKRDFSVLLGRYGSMKNVFGKICDFVRYVTLKMCDLNSDVNLFLLRIYFRF